MRCLARLRHYTFQPIRKYHLPLQIPGIYTSTSTPAFWRKTKLPFKSFGTRYPSGTASPSQSHFLREPVVSREARDLAPLDFAISVPIGLVTSCVASYLRRSVPSHGARLRRVNLIEAGSTQYLPGSPSFGGRHSQVFIVLSPWTATGAGE